MFLEYSHSLVEFLQFLQNQYLLKVIRYHKMFYDTFYQKVYKKVYIKGYKK